MLIDVNPPQEPIAGNVEKYEKLYRIYTGLYPALKENYRQLAELEL